MKSVLRHQSLGFTALAAIALSLSACSGAEGIEIQPSDSTSVDDAQRASSADSTQSEPTAHAATASAQEQTVARAEQPQVAPSAGTETPAAATSPAPTPAAAASPAAAPTANEAAGDEAADEGVDEIAVAAPEIAETPVETSPAPAPATSPAPTDAGNPVDEVAEETSPAPVHSNTMRVVGNQLLDTCGQPFVVRGVEQILGNQLPQGNDWLGLVRQIASTGANAVRILPGVNTLDTQNVDDILTFIGQQGMVAFIDPLNSPDDWYARDDVRAMLKKHESFLIIDAYGEPQYDDIEKWRAEAKDALVHMRSLGYEVPFTVYANQFGRGLPSLFDYGAEILAADPLHNTFLGWQAYWGQGGYYQEHYGYSLDEAVDAIVASGLPIQMGLDHVTDLPSETADYGTLMRAAEENGIGWLWWDFYNPYGAENNLSQDGSADNLTSTGADVLVSHSASVANTAKRACSR